MLASAADPIVPRMEPSEVIAGQVIELHDALEELLADAAAAAALLVMDPTNADTELHWRIGRRFVERAVAHMTEEEDTAFVAAERAGIAKFALDALRLDHVRLRFLAARILGRHAPDEDGALELLRFVNRFEQHVAREEWTLVAGPR